MEPTKTKYYKVEIYTNYETSGVCEMVLAVDNKTSLNEEINKQLRYHEILDNNNTYVRTTELIPSEHVEIKKIQSKTEYYI